jgi:uncharacterized membrane protein required for colicin V production
MKENIYMLFTTTDYVVGVLLLVFFLTGWRKGFLRALIGPISFTVCCVVATIHFDLTGNIFTSFLIAITGTFFLSIILRFVLFLVRRSVDKDYRDYVFIGSRFLGGIFSLIWKGTITVMIVLVISLLPGKIRGVDKIHESIIHSMTYSLVNQYVIRRIPVARDTFYMLSLFKDPELADKLSSTREYKEFFSDERIQELLSDDDIQRHMEEGDITKLISNPKIISVVQDDKLMKKLTVLNGKILSQGQEEKQK